MDIYNKQYFEGTLQIRNATQEIFEYVDNQIERDNQHLAKVKKVKGGRDYYMGDNKWMVRLGKKLKGKFSGDLKVTSTLFTLSKLTSKEVHRVTVMFRHVPFKINTLLHWRGREVQVRRFGPKVEVKDLKSGQRELVSYEELLANATVVQ